MDAAILYLLNKKFKYVAKENFVKWQWSNRALFFFRQIIESKVQIKILKMLKEIVIFSIGVVVGIVVGFAINGFEIDINVNHNINMPTGIVIGGATPTN